MTTETLMPAEKMLNVRLPAALHESLARLTKATGRTKSFLAVQALTTYIETEAWQIQDIEQGLAEADRGEFATPEEVNTFFQAYGC
jgi:predicted transcriptional regulator